MIIVSRQDGISLERLHIKYRIMTESEIVPMKFYNKKKSRTFYVNGLWLYGAKWDEQEQTISDLHPSDLTCNEIPTLQLDIEEFNPVGSIQLNGQEIAIEANTR